MAMSKSKIWDLRYMELAALVATWSKDPSTKVGSVVVGDSGQILSTGYNGFPRGVSDTDERLNDRDTKYLYTSHAEMNCIYNAALSGLSLKNSTMYVSGLPICSECSKGIIQVGISRVVIENPEGCPDKWKQSFKLSKNMLDERGIVVDYV